MSDLELELETAVSCLLGVEDLQEQPVFRTAEPSLQFLFHICDICVCDICDVMSHMHIYV